MTFFGFCFILYLLKLSAGYGFWSNIHSWNNSGGSDMERYLAMIEFFIVTLMFVHLFSELKLRHNVGSGEVNFVTPMSS